MSCLTLAGVEVASDGETSVVEGQSSLAAAIEDACVWFCIFGFETKSEKERKLILKSFDIYVQS